MWEIYIEHTVETQLGNQMWDSEKSDRIMTWSPDRVSRNMEGRIRDWDKMVVIKV